MSMFFGERVLGLDLNDKTAVALSLALKNLALQRAEELIIAFFGINLKL
jgi:hypothetical protein